MEWHKNNYYSAILLTYGAFSMRVILIILSEDTHTKWCPSSEIVHTDNFA